MDAPGDVVRANRQRATFHPIVDSKFAPRELDLVLKEAAKRTVLPAAIVP